MGNKTLEIQPSSIEKATVVKAILKDLINTCAASNTSISQEGGLLAYDPNLLMNYVDFILCICDSRSDESAFSLLSDVDIAYTATVGKKKSKTKAKYYLSNASEAQNVVQHLVS